MRLRLWTHMVAELGLSTALLRFPPECISSLTRCTHIMLMDRPVWMHSSHHTRYHLRQCNVIPSTSPSNALPHLASQVRRPICAQAPPCPETGFLGEHSFVDDVSIGLTSRFYITAVYAVFRQFVKSSPRTAALRGRYSSHGTRPETWCSEANAY